MLIGTKKRAAVFTVRKKRSRRVKLSNADSCKMVSEVFLINYLNKSAKKLVFIK